MNKSVSTKFLENPYSYLLIDLILVLPFLLLPLFVSLPYRVNIFLTYEGAYRMLLGQVPFQDYGQPMGFGFWLIPLLFFKLFGPTFMSLVKAQVFINFISLAAVRGILYNLKIKPIAITLSLLIFCLTYVIYNFWPWYNHIVVVFELVTFFFLTAFSNAKSKWGYYLCLVLTGFFCFLTIFTKQDVGGISLLYCLFVLGYISLNEKSVKPLIPFVLSFGVTASLFILPFLHHDFLYWFNYGQPPHSSRISIGLLLDVFLSNSILEKVYLLILLGAVILHVPSFRAFYSDRSLFLTLTLCVVLILQSLVTRVTSPLPTDHMTYFHTFAFIGVALFLPWEKWSRTYASIGILILCLGFIYSAGVWKYISSRIPVHGADATATAPTSKPWVEGTLPTLRHVLVPPETNRGIEEIMALPFLHKKELKVLNMSELTFLAYEIGYSPLTNQPLWYHLNVGMFQKQVDEINRKVNEGYYDLVLFQSIASLPTFYPQAISDELKKKYLLYDTFEAPRKLEDSSIDVFINPDLAKAYALRSVIGDR